MLLRNSGKIQIDAITMVIGNHWPRQGAEYLARVLKATGRSDIPIYIGADQPLRNTHARMDALEKGLIRKGMLNSSDGLWKGAYSRAKEVKTQDEVVPAEGESLSGILPQTRNAVDFIVEKLMSSPDDSMTFAAIGPLTNLARAIKKEPAITRKIHRLLFMGGNVDVPGNTTPYAELNVLFDPEATEAVFESDIREKVIFPLDLSDQMRMNQTQFAELTAEKNPITSMLNADQGPEFKNPKFQLQAWDTTVAAYLIDPSYVTESRDLALRVVEDLGPRYGSIRKSGGTQMIRVMTKMDTGRFFSILKRNLGEAR